MGVYNATVITAAGQNLIADAIAGGEAVNFSSVKTSTHVYPAGTSLQNLTALDDVKQSVAPTSVDVYNNNVVQVSARVPNTGIATAYLINTIGLFGQVSGGTETLIAVLTASTPDEVPVFDPESPAAFIFNVQMTIQNADTVTFEVNDSGTATVADLNRVSQPFSGATASAAGTVGRVPAPAAGDDGKFLRGDATWAAPADMAENFTSSDVADGSATTWTSVSKLDSGETNASIFAKMSQMFKNIRFLYKMLGTTDISSIGNGTVTGGLSSLNSSFTIPDGRRLSISATGLVYQTNEGGTWTDWWKSYYGNGKFVLSRTGTNIDFEYPGVYLLIEGVQRNNVAFTAKIGVYVVSFAGSLITYNKIFDGYDSAPTVTVSGTTLEFVHGSSLNLGIVSYRLY